MCNCRQHELELDLVKSLQRALKQRSRLDAEMVKHGYSDEAKEIEQSVMNEVGNCRAVIDVMVRWDDLPHQVIDWPHGEPPF